MKIFYYIAILATTLAFTACKEEAKDTESEKVIETVETFPITIGEFDMEEGPRELSERELSYSDIRGLTPIEIRILRNAIYALHNRAFQSNDLTDYFKMFSWYTPLYNDYEISLNRIEQKNIQFLAANG